MIRVLRWFLGFTILALAIATGINEAFFAKHQCEDCVGWDGKPKPSPTAWRW